jgi:hypothetical protein
MYKSHGMARTNRVERRPRKKRNGKKDGRKVANCNMMLKGRVWVSVGIWILSHSPYSSSGWGAVLFFGGGVYWCHGFFFDAIFWAYFPRA